MRRRYQVNLYTEHSKHLELIEHLMSFDKNKRSSELTMLILAGYQVLYGKGDTGLDRSTSLLLDERDHLISLLASRLGQHPAPKESYGQPTLQSEIDGHKFEKGKHQDFSSSTEASPASHQNDKPSQEISKPAKNSNQEPLISSNSGDKVKTETEPKRIYGENDLADEDPLIHDAPDQDLEEDIVDPLSLFD